MSYELHYKQIGTRIRDRRKELKLTLEEVANQIGVTKGTVQKYETGIIHRMGEEKLELLARVLKTTPFELINGKIINDHIDFIVQVKKRYGNELLEIIDKWDFLNKEGKQEVVKRVNELIELSKYRDNEYILSLKSNQDDESEGI